ncbi:MAG: hypothetical protein PHE27_06155 [Alphaproteobacteria bacterium]|nr:hypothetical protein [Alphaproteobacteria bacterium]
MTTNESSATGFECIATDPSFVIEYKAPPEGLAYRLTLAHENCVKKVQDPKSLGNIADIIGKEITAAATSASAVLVADRIKHYAQSNGASELTEKINTAIRKSGIEPQKEDFRKELEKLKQLQKARMSPTETEPLAIAMSQLFGDAPIGAMAQKLPGAFITPALAEHVAQKTKASLPEERLSAQEDLKLLIENHPHSITQSVYESIVLSAVMDVSEEVRNQALGNFELLKNKSFPKEHTVEMLEKLSAPKSPADTNQRARATQLLSDDSFALTKALRPTKKIFSSLKARYIKP